MKGQEWRYLFDQKEKDGCFTWYVPGSDGGGMETNFGAIKHFIKVSRQDAVKEFCSFLSEDSEVVNLEYLNNKLVDFLSKAENQ